MGNGFLDVIHAKHFLMPHKPPMEQSSGFPDFLFSMGCLELCTNVLWTFSIISSGTSDYPEYVGSTQKIFSYKKTTFCAIFKYVQHLRLF